MIVETKYLELFDFYTEISRCICNVMSFSHFLSDALKLKLSCQKPLANFNMFGQVLISFSRSILIRIQIIMLKNKFDIMEHYFLGWFHVFMLELHYAFSFNNSSSPKAIYYNGLVFNVEYKKIKMQRIRLYWSREILQI